MSNLRLGASTLDILLHRRGQSVAVTVLDKTGTANVEVVLTSSARASGAHAPGDPARRSET